MLCYVTDRRGLAITADDNREAALLERIRAAIAGGVDWVQLREKDLDAQPLLRLATSAVEASRASATRILVNDRLDVALAAAAGGVHLGEASLPVGAVSGWKHSPAQQDFIAGVSCHSLETAQAAARDGADYIFFGPVFPTPSKAAFGPPQGLTRLGEVSNAVGIPVFAIGGITESNAAACLDAGATGIAGIRLFQDAPDLAALVGRLR